MSDPAEDICDEIVTVLSALQEETPNPFAPLRFEAHNSLNPNAELEKVTDTITILLWPHDYGELKTGRGNQSVNRHDISMIVARNLTNEITRRTMHALVTAIIGELRGRAIAGYKWSGVESSKADLERLHNGQFATATILKYIGTC